MSAVILIRQAMPEVVQGTSSKFWGLSEAAREDCVMLAHALPAGLASPIWSSDERKARETAEVLGLRLGLDVAIDPRFQEVDRPQVWDRDYREVAAGYLAGTHEPGWETQDSVVARFSAAISDAFAESRDVLVVNHGMAMGLWVASITGIEIVAWWRELTFPDAWRVDVESRSVERLWMGGARGD